MKQDNAIHPRRAAATGLMAAALALAAVPAWSAGTGPQARPDWPLPVDDTTAYAKLLFDRLEYGFGEDEDTLTWDAQFWYGGDYERLWIETEGEYVASGGDGGELENFDVLYSRRVSPYWDLQAGVGYQRISGDGPEPDRLYGVVGVQGLAPYWFEIDANLRVSEDGDAWVDLEAEYDWLLTQRLILQPRFETSYAFGEVEEFGVGQGLNSVQAGLRLRYEIRRELAPYLGVTWLRRLGDTADLAEAEGEDADSTAIVAGVRMWF